MKQIIGLVILFCLNHNNVSAQLEVEVTFQFESESDSSINISFYNPDTMSHVIWLQSWKIAAFPIFNNMMYYPHWNRGKNEVYLYKENVNLSNLIDYSGDSHPDYNYSLPCNSLKVLEPQGTFSISVKLLKFDTQGLYKLDSTKLRYLYSIAPYTSIEKYTLLQEFPDLFYSPDTISFSILGHVFVNHRISQDPVSPKCISGLDSGRSRALENLFTIKRYEKDY